MYYKTMDDNRTEEEKKRDGELLRKKYAEEKKNSRKPIQTEIDKMFTYENLVEKSDIDLFEFCADVHKNKIIPTRVSDDGWRIVRKKFKQKMKEVGKQSPQYNFWKDLFDMAENLLKMPPIGMSPELLKEWKDDKKNPNQRNPHYIDCYDYSFQQDDDE
jgi:hypothetical protein